jgi:hypothetical protein
VFRRDRFRVLPRPVSCFNDTGFVFWRHRFRVSAKPVSCSVDTGFVFRRTSGTPISNIETCQTWPLITCLPKMLLANPTSTHTYTRPWLKPLHANSRATSTSRCCTPICVQRWRVKTHDRNTAGIVPTNIFWSIGVCVCARLPLGPLTTGTGCKWLPWLSRGQLATSMALRCLLEALPPMNSRHACCTLAGPWLATHAANQSTGP